LLLAGCEENASMVEAGFPGNKRREQKNSKYAQVIFLKVNTEEAYDEPVQNVAFLSYPCAFNTVLRMLWLIVRRR
jgi:hypothetical protein